MYSAGGRCEGSISANPLVPLLAALLLAAPAPLHARSLTDKLHRFFDTEGFPTGGEFIEVVTPLVERLALRGIDYPVTATAPGFTYRFNFELAVPERSSESLGPVYVERAETVGRHRLDLGMSYLFADLTDFDGDEFSKEIVTRGRRRAPPFVFNQAFIADDFGLTSQVLSLSATFGLTDAWDVNVLQPLVWTGLELTGTASAMVTVDGNVARSREHVRFDENAFGPGDTLLRTKYRVAEGGPVSVALGTTLRLPAGNEEDLHGLGDTIVTPSVILSRAVGMQDMHGSLGLELNADDAERHRARYALGASLQPAARVAFLVDVLGSSSFTDDGFEVRAPAGRVFPGQLFGTDRLVRSRRPTEIVAFVPRSDVVDLALGLKINPFRTGVGFASVILPLTDDGLRPEVIVTGGVEVTF